MFIAEYKKCKVSQEFRRLFSGNEMLRKPYACDMLVGQKIIDDGEYNGDI